MLSGNSDSPFFMLPAVSYLPQLPALHLKHQGPARKGAVGHSLIVCGAFVAEMMGAGLLSCQRLGEPQKGSGIHAFIYYLEECCPIYTEGY